MLVAVHDIASMFSAAQPTYGPASVSAVSWLTPRSSVAGAGSSWGGAVISCGGTTWRLTAKVGGATNPSVNTAEQSQPSVFFVVCVFISVSSSSLSLRPAVRPAASRRCYLHSTGAALPRRVRIAAENVTDYRTAKRSRHARPRPTERDLG